MVNGVKSKNKSKVEDIDANYDFIDKPRFTCAFGGALTTITAIPGYIPIIHGGPGCGVQIQFGQTFQGGFRGTPGISGVSVPSTNLYENEVIFDGEKRLEEEIRTTIELIDGKQYVIITACTSELIGDDIKGVVKKFENKIPLSFGLTAGFKGSTYQGYELLLDSFVDQIVEEGPKNGKLVNILGIIPSQDVFWEGNLNEIERLLNRLGLEVNTLFNGKNIKNLSKAGLNIVLSPWVGFEAAKKLENKYNTPYIISPLPIGTEKTTEFLKNVGDALKIDVDKIIKEEEEKTFYYIEKVADVIVDFDMQLKFAVIADSNYAIAINNFFVKEIGWIPSTTIITDNVPAEHRETIRKHLNFGDTISPDVVFEVDTFKIWNHLRDEQFDVLFGSSLDNDFANEKHVPKISISFPVTDKIVIKNGYAGYEGTINLLEDVLTVIASALF